jgi:hypothetical protein
MRVVITIFVVFFLLLVSLFPFSTYAQFELIRFDYCAFLGLADCDPELARPTLVLLIGGFLSLVAMIAMVVLVWAGVKYITAQGDEDEARRAKMIFLYTIVGLIVMGLSGVAVNWLLSL